MLKLNIGSHSKRINGFTNVDVLPLENVDIRHDLTQMPWPFKMSTVDEILAMEFLEHIGWRDTQAVINECYRILKPGGKLRIQVPDIEEMINNFVNGEICDCVPKKSDSIEGYKADPGCFACGGKGKVNPMRWYIAFCGAQKHEFDTHKSIFTYAILTDYLKKANFKNIVRKPQLYKLIVEAEK